VHSRYRRRVADLPVSGRPVVLWLTVRRFFCDHVDCSACTFVEQVMGLTERHSRRSAGLQGALVAVALAPGRAGRSAADRRVGHEGEPVDVAAADPRTAGSADRPGDSGRVSMSSRCAAGTTTARCWSI
jgi:hypothetical protein